MQASLDLANAGYYVYLVEKTSAIGGRMAQLDKTFPTNDCAMCIDLAQADGGGRNLNIEIITHAEVQAMDGPARRLQRGGAPKAPLRGPKNCTGCGDCIKECPVAVPDEFDLGLNQRKAIYKHMPRPSPTPTHRQAGPRPLQGGLPGRHQRARLRALIGQGGQVPRGYPS